MKQAAVIQINSQPEVNYNLGEIRLLLREAAECGAALAVLPEMFMTLDGKQFRAIADDPLYIRQLSGWAREFGLWLVAGAMPQPSPDGDPRLRSACLVFSAQGELAARYDKVHLFDVDVGDAQGSYRESERFAPGDQAVVVDTPLGKLGLVICYDLRFPGLFQSLRDQGAELISVPAAFTYKTGEAHWQTLLRARAIENQCYILAADQCGWHDGRRQTWGHSQIIDPWGEVLTELQHEPALALAEVDLQRVAEVRRRMPVQAHRRF